MAHKDINSIPPRSKTNPILNRSETQAVLNHLQNRYVADGMRSITNSDGTSNRVNRNEPLWSKVVAHDHLDQWSVFTIETIGEYSDSYALAKTKAVDGTEDYSIFLTNEQYETTEGSPFFPQIIGSHRPQKVRYSGEKPVVGDKLGVVPNQFVVSKSYTGLIAFSDGDDENNFVWVVKDLGAGSPLKMGITTIPPYASGSGSEIEYPLRPANTFWVEEIEELTFEEKQGWTCLEYVPNGSYYLVRDINDAYHEQDDIVTFWQKGSRWFMAENPEILFRGTLKTDLCSDDAEIEDVYRVPDNLPVPELNQPGNKYNHRGKAGQEILFVSHLIEAGSGSGSGSVSGSGNECERPAFEYNIVEIEKRPICVTNGIKDADDCLHYGTLATVLEWCPAGEPAYACPAVIWYDCDGVVDAGSGSGAQSCAHDWDLVICDPGANSGSGSGSGGSGSGGDDCDCCPD